MMPNVYPGRACADARCRLVVSPRGTLSSWALDRNALPEKGLLAHGAGVRAESLPPAFTRRPTPSSRTFVGQAFDSRCACCPMESMSRLPRRAPQDGPRQLLYLGRIHPMKGIDILLNAWHAVQQRFPDWELHIAGPDNDGYLAAMQDSGRAAEAGAGRLPRAALWRGEAPRLSRRQRVRACRRTPRTSA